MKLTKLQAEVLQAAPLVGRYILGLGHITGKWMWFVGDKPVTRHANKLISMGLLVADIPENSPSGHPVKFKATAARP